MLAWVVSGRLPYQRHSTSAGKIIPFHNLLWLQHVAPITKNAGVRAGPRTFKDYLHTPIWALALPPWVPLPQVASLVLPLAKGPPSCAHKRRNGAKVSYAFNVNVTFSERLGLPTLTCFDSILYYSHYRCIYFQLPIQQQLQRSFACNNIE